MPRISSSSFAVATTAGLIAAVIVLHAQTPAIIVAPQSTNQVKVTITNAVVGVAYELYRTPVLGDDYNYPWVLEVLGATNQTIFYADTEVEQSGFFRISTPDWDSDGVPNYQDAQPNNAAVGRLTITIQFPTTGSTVN